MRKFLILFSIILSIQTFSEGNYITIKPSKQSEEKNKVSKINPKIKNKSKKNKNNITKFIQKYIHTL